MPQRARQEQIDDPQRPGKEQPIGRLRLAGFLLQRVHGLIQFYNRRHLAGDGILNRAVDLQQAIPRAPLQRVLRVGQVTDIKHDLAAEGAGQFVFHREGPPDQSGQAAVEDAPLRVPDLERHNRGAERRRPDEAL